MMLRRRKKQEWSGEYDTYVEHDGTEFDVKVHWEASPAEPDVNWPGSFEVTSVWYEDEGDIIDDLSAAELADLTERMQELAFPDPDEEY